MGALKGNGMHDSARELTEMASTQFAFYGLMNPYTYQRPKITPLPNETGLTVPGGTGVAVVPNGTPPALKQPYLPGPVSYTHLDVYKRQTCYERKTAYDMQ